MRRRTPLPSEENKLREKKIQKIKNKIKKGVYKIDNSKLSEAIINNKLNKDKRDVDPEFMQSYCEVPGGSG